MSDLLQSLIAGGIEPSGAIRIADAIVKALPAAQTTVVSSATTVVNNYSQTSYDLPAVFTAPIETQQAAVFSGNAQFSGPMTINGQVNWGGVTCRPTPVSTVGAVGVSGGNLFFQPLELGALNNFGLGKPQRVVFQVAPVSSQRVITAVTANTSGGTAVVPDTASFNPETNAVMVVSQAIKAVGAQTFSVLSTLSDITAKTGTFSFPTKWSLDPDSCTITASGTTTVYYVSEVTLTKEPRTCSGAITSSSATPSTVTYLTGGTVGLTGPTASFLTSATLSAAGATLWDSLSAGVQAVTLSDP